MQHVNNFYMFYSQILLFPGVIIAHHASNTAFHRSTKEYWENLCPCTGRPYSASMVKPNNWGVHHGGKEHLKQHNETTTMDSMKMLYYTKFYPPFPHLTFLIIFKLLFSNVWLDLLLDLFNIKNNTYLYNVVLFSFKYQPKIIVSHLCSPVWPDWAIY